MAGEVGGGIACCALVAVVVFLLLFGWGNLSPTEVGLKFSMITQTVDPQVVQTPGVMFLGPFTSLMKYPKTIQTIEFNAQQGDLLDGRTSDGLPLVLGLSFQYRLLPNKLYDLYHTYEQSSGDYERFYRLVGIHFVTEMSTKYTANEFFNEKQRIATEMRVELNKYFSANLFATVESLQINEDDLPAPFTEALLESQIINTNKTKMKNVKQSKIVELQTAVIVAQSQANVTVQKAQGEKHQILQNGDADVAIIKAYVEAEIGAYGHIYDEMELTGDDLIQYIWYDTLGGGSVAANANAKQDLTVFVNVNPSSYIQTAVPPAVR